MSRAAHRWLKRTLPALILTLTALAGAVWHLNHLDESPATAAKPPAAASPEQIARGAYLARAGNCAACHTARGGAAYAGGRGMDTPFGTVFAGNLTPDAEHGLGRWTADDFWRALHNGKSADGRLLYPAFPYLNTTRISRADADDLFAYLRSLPADNRANRPHELRFPYNTQSALAVWRALYFRPGVQLPDPAQSASWNRGAYLVQGLGHCSACHAARDGLGGALHAERLSGGVMPSQGWYAPSLNDPQEGGVAHWTDAEVVALLKTGRNAHASASGPMAEVVQGSTQHLNDADLLAMAHYLKALPPSTAAPDKSRAPTGPADDRVLGAKLYEQHCAQCHGAQGQGMPGMYPALDGNRALSLHAKDNLLRLILNGGFAASTAANPRPFGMPPYAVALSDQEIAAVASFVRHEWGRGASPVSAFEVAQARGKRSD